MIDNYNINCIIGLWVTPFGECVFFYFCKKDINFRYKHYLAKKCKKNDRKKVR